MRKRKLQKRQVSNRMGISYDTLRKYLQNPDTMTGKDRKSLALAIDVSIDYIDNICNGNITIETPLPK